MMPIDLAKLDLSDLRAELKEIASLHPRLEYHERFVMWFLLAFASNRPVDALGALTGWKGERGMDAVYIDDDAKRVFIVQGKYRTKLMRTKENADDLLDLADKALVFADDDKEFKDFLESLEPLAYQSAVKARERLMERGYTLSLCYVTTGRFGDKDVNAAARHGVNDLFQTEFLYFDGKRVMDMLRDYLEGSAPAVPEILLPLTRKEIVRHSDADLKHIRSWVFTMNGKAVADLFKAHDVKLFHKNIRGFLGMRSEVNKQIKATIEEEPEFFWYFNNGVTILCDRAEPLNNRIKVKNAQVINGQQTTRTLFATGKDAAETDVLVRLIEVSDQDRYPNLTKHVVEATNSQNKIDVVDMKSNAPEQVWLQRKLFKRGYHYVRKRQAPGEVKTPRGYTKVTKEYLARAVAATQVEAQPFHVGRKPLFDDYYDDIFSMDREVDDYLARFWLMKRVESLVRGRADTWKYGKWLGAYEMWRDVKSMRRRPRAFIEASENRHESLLCFDDAGKRLFRLISAFTVKNRAGRTSRLFFQADQRHREFRRFVEGRGRVRAAYRDYKDAIRELDAALKKLP